MERRSFLRGILAAAMAPAIGSSEILMPIKALRGRSRVIGHIDEIGWFTIEQQSMVIANPRALMTGEIGVIHGLSFTESRVLPMRRQLDKWVQTVRKQDWREPVYLPAELYPDLRGQRA